MLKITENEKELMLRDLPAGMWLAGLSLAAASAIPIYLLAVFFYDNPEFLSSQNAAAMVALLLCLIGFCWGIYLFLKTPVITTLINSQTKTLTIEHKSLLKKETRGYKFDELNRRLELQTIHGENSKYFSPQLQLKGGEIIELMSWGMMNKGKCYDVIDLANRYLAEEADKTEFKLTILNDD